MLNLLYKQFKHYRIIVIHKGDGISTVSFYLH
jgi:hypothetical protein